MTRLEQLGPWPARLLWVVLALVSSGTLDDALGDRSTAIRAVTLAGLGLAWLAGLVALLVPRSSALTAMRTLVPAGLAATLAAVVVGSTTDAADVASVTVAALAAVWVLAPWIGEAWVDGSSYGPEHRLLLRPPALFAAVLAPLTWIVVVVGASVGPLLLAAEQWPAGVLCLVVGWAAAAAGARSLHQLARRWVVLVPTGLVIHDSLTMPEPQLVPRTMIRRFGPALADTDAHDLTAGASGLALELAFAEPLDLLVRSGARSTTTHAVDGVLLTPSRPKHLLDAAVANRIPVG